MMEEETQQLEEKTYLVRGTLKKKKKKNSVYAILGIDGT